MLEAPPSVYSRIINLTLHERYYKGYRATQTGGMLVPCLLCLSVHSFQHLLDSASNIRMLFDTSKAVVPWIRTSAPVCSCNPCSYTDAHELFFFKNVALYKEIKKHVLLRSNKFKFHMGYCYCICFYKQIVTITFRVFNVKTKFSRKHFVFVFSSFWAIMLQKHWELVFFVSQLTDAYNFIDSCVLVAFSG